MVCAEDEELRSLLLKKSANCFLTEFYTYPIDSSAVDANCKGGTTPSDSTEEHQGGRVYLAIQAAGDWTAEVQEKG